MVKRKTATGMDGATVRLPSGRLLSEITDLRKATPDEVAWVVARFMFSHATGNRYYANIEFAIEASWSGTTGAQRKGMARRVAKRLYTNGFTTGMDNTKTNGGRFYWQLPSIFPAWQSDGDANREPDDGSQTTGGPVTRSVVTANMKALYGAITQDPARHPRDYKVTLGWTTAQVTGVGRTLADHGYIQRKGKTMAARYYLTDKPFPGGGVPPQPKTVVVTREPKASDLTEEHSHEVIAPKPEPQPVDNGLLFIYELEAGFYRVVDGKIVRAGLRVVKL